MELLSGPPRKLRIVEVGPPDGLPNEAVMVSNEDKLRFIGLLSEAGFSDVETTSFVSPRAIPKLADAGRLVPALDRSHGTRYPVLVPNVRGLERAVAAEHRRRGGAGQTGGGSLPVKREGETLGAIACSGASDAIDLACAEAGLASLDSQR
jgi:Haem-degrading